MKYRRLPGEPNIFRIPRGGPPPDVECPLKCGDCVSLESCFDCEFYNDDFENRSSHCRIEEKQERERMARDQEELEREIAERDRKSEEEDRKMRREMAAWRAEMEKNRKKWEKEYEKEQERYEQKEQEWEEMRKKFIADIYGESTLEWTEAVLERMKNKRNRRGSERYDDDEEDWEDENELK